jgi:hypothetical protein
MKKIIVLTFISLFIFTTISYSQQGQPSAEQRQFHEQKADSAIANRTVKQIKQLFALTADQEQTLYLTAVQINNSRRNVFKTYWRTEAFHEQMSKMDKRADSLYQSIVGVTNYQLYKDMVKADMIRRQAIMKQRISMQKKDTINIKSNNP